MNYELAGLDVSRETIEKLEAFAEITRKWTARINLISPTTLPDLWERHIVDSAQLWAYAPKYTEKWVDLGSGAGFPGLVISALAQGSGATTQVLLVESDQRKATFLRTAIRELGLPATVIAERAERVEPLAANVVSARALASLIDLLPYISRHLAQDGLALLHKGRQFEQEIATARTAWSFDATIHESQTDSSARILNLSRIARV